MIKLLLGLFILYLLINKVGAVNIYNMSKNMDLKLYFLFFIIILSNFIFGAANISILLSKIKRVRFITLLNYYMVSWSIGLFAPGKVGEFSIIYFLKKEGISIGKGTAISMIDKLITITVLAIFSIIGFFSFFELQYAIIISLVICVAIISIPVIMTNTYFKKILGIKIINKFTKKFTGFSRTIKTYAKEHQKALFLNFIVTSIKWALNGVAVSILFVALGKSVNVLTIILINSVVLITGLVPITMNGIGIKEVVVLLLYGKVGISQAIALSMSIITLTTNLFIALLIVFFSRLTFQNTKKEIEVEHNG